MSTSSARPLIDPAAADLRLGEVERLLEHFEQLESQFQKVRQGLTHSHRLATLGTIASIIAHEYNNILTPVISYSQLALAKPDDQELMRKAVEKALAGAERAASISASLLGFAREQDGEQEADVAKVVAEALQCLGREPQKDGIQVEIDLPEGAKVAISPLNLQQVFLNLVLNARKAMRRKGGVLTIRGKMDGEHIRIEVSDTGPGVPPQIADRLFEPFVTHRIDAEADPSAPKGTGLGLCICRDVLRNAGGDITYKSTPGAGATFVLLVPRSQSPFEST